MRKLASNLLRNGRLTYSLYLLLRQSLDRRIFHQLDDVFVHAKNNCHLNTKYIYFCFTKDMLKNVQRTLNGFRRVSSFGESGSAPTHPFPEFSELKSFEEIHKYSINNHEEFWGRIARSQIKWHKDFTTTGFGSKQVYLNSITKKARLIMNHFYEKGKIIIIVETNR